MKTIRIAIFILIAATSAHAQQENTLHLMQAIPQSTYNNPAYTPRYNIYVGLPVISSIFATASSSFSYNDLITIEDGKKVLDIKKLNSKLKKTNYINNIESVDLLSFGFRASPKLYFNFNMSAENYQKIKYPDDILTLFVDGNASKIGTPLNFSFEGNSISYLSTAFGASYEVDERLTVGTRMKVLSGGISAYTERANLSVLTDDDYAITLSGDMLIHTSGIQSKTEDWEPSLDDVRAMTKNRGFAMDVGGSYQFTDRIKAGLSFTNLGAIKWREDVESYTLDQKNDFTYRGLNINDLIKGEEKDMLDSLSNTFEFDTLKGGAYSQALPMRMYMSGSYYIGRQATAGLVIFTEKFNSSYQAGFTAMINKDFGKRLALALSYTYASRSFNNLGAGFAFNFVPFQLYVVSDNLITGPLNYRNVKTVNVRLGLNIILGWDQTQNTLPGTVKMKY